MPSLRCLLTAIQISAAALLVLPAARAAVGQEVLLNDPRGHSLSTLPPRWGRSVSFQAEAEGNDDTSGYSGFRECATPEELSLVLKPLSEVSMQIRPGPEYLPPNCHELHVGQSGPRDITHLARSSTLFHIHWAPTGMVRYPLYFEEVALERYGLGFSPTLQPIVSGVRFYSRVATLPYRLGVDAPNKIIYTLGYERPGNFAPSVREHLPISAKGAFFQAATVVGGIYLFP